MLTVLLEDIGAFAADYGGDSRIRAGGDQPGAGAAPPKPTDNRGAHFSGTETWQAEALDPNDLAQILEDAIRDRLDKATYDFRASRRGCDPRRPGGPAAIR